MRLHPEVLIAEAVMHGSAVAATAWSAFVNCKQGTRSRQAYSSSAEDNESWGLMARKQVLMELRVSWQESMYKKQVVTRQARNVSRDLRRL